MECSLCKPQERDYLRFQDYCERMAKKGLKQTRCPSCGKWNWPDEYKSTPLKAVVSDVTEKGGGE